MIEKLARAVSAKHYSERFKTPPDDPWVQRNVDGNWQLEIQNVRAVLTALREPDEGVCRAIAHAAWRSGSGQDPANILKAAIDHILQEGDRP